MLTFSTNPDVAEQQMNAIIFYMTAFGYIDGNFDFTEKTFVKVYIRQLVTERAKTALPDADERTRDDVVNRFTTHFHEVFEQIDRNVKGLFDEAVADGEDVEKFVYAKLKLRSYEIFQSFDRDNQIALLSTIVATALGTLIALALVRYQFRGSATTNLLIFLPMATPEIVLGASLLTLFVAIGQPPFFPTNFVTILIAHIMFNISYVVVTVKARLANFPRHLEEAAMDLGANEWTTFWKVTFPLILPGVVAAALLAFSLSIDDYVITAFTSGQTETFPLFIYGSQLRGIPVQVNVIGTIIFVSAVLLVLLTTLWQRRVAARDYGAGV